MTEPTTCTVSVEFLRGVIALCTQRGYSPENIEAWSKDDKWVADLWRQAADSVLEDALSQAASDVLAERQRQISAEGWTQSHDDLEHEPGQLSSAAACYALNASAWLKRPYVSRADYATLGFINLSDWPWDGSWWKPKNERRDLVRAGALIIAELERMDRAAAAPTPPAHAADSVLEDAARLEFEMQHGSAIAAARKQGGV